MRVLENGVYREMTPEEVLQTESSQELSRKDAIITAIRQRYSVDDEIAILRQRDTKPQEFLEYFEFVEGVKSAAPRDDEVAGYD